MEYGYYLRRAARQFGSRIAVRSHDGAEQLTYAQLDDRADAVARFLIAQGIEKGDRVATIHANSPRVLELDFGIARSGGVRVPVNARASADEVAHLVNHSGAKAVIFDDPFDQLAAQLRARVEAKPLFIGRGDHVDVDYETAFSDEGERAHITLPRVDESDLLSIKYTGGSTGKPKGTLRTHRAQEAIALNILLDLYPFAADDILLQVQPLSHGAGAFILPAVMRGATQVTMRTFDAAQAARLIEDSAVTVVKLVPTMLYRILDQLDGPLPASADLRAVIFGASPISEAGIRRAHELLGPRVVQTYGQTEAPVTITCFGAADYFHSRERGDERGRSVGRPYSTVDVEIRGEDGSALPANEVGRVFVRGPMLMSGYWSSDATAVDDDGWLDTGDIGRFDGDGYLYLVDRANDMIISGGFNVYPRELEVALEEHAEVGQAIVIGLPHPDWGETVAAVVVPKSADSIDVDDLDAHVRQTIASYKAPKTYIVTSHIPVSPVGKVTRRLVKTALADELGLLAVGGGKHVHWERQVSDE